MIKTEKVIIVEGKYDKIKLSSFVDGIIIPTDGFRIFKDKDMQKLIKHFAKTSGIVVLTDSDAAGFKIRSFIKNIAKEGSIQHIYIPDVYGKEKRKAVKSAEGKLGVEGIDVNLLKAELQGIETEEITNPITKAEMFTLGLSGGKNSRQIRLELLKQLNLPQHMSSNTLSEILPRLVSSDELENKISAIVQKLNENS